MITLLLSKWPIVWNSRVQLQLWNMDISTMFFWTMRWSFHFRTIFLQAVFWGRKAYLGNLYGIFWAFQDDSSFLVFILAWISGWRGFHPHFCARPSLLFLEWIHEGICAGTKEIFQNTSHVSYVLCTTWYCIKKVRKNMEHWREILKSVFLRRWKINSLWRPRKGWESC